MRDHLYDSRENFDRQEDRYDTAGCGAHARKLYPLVLAQLAQIPHRRILDLGCGTGELLASIRGRWPETVCAGLDLSPRMLEVARRKLGEGAELVQGEAGSLPFREEQFDVVLCTDSFHHYPDPGRVLEEVARVLLPGGVFLLADTTAPGPFRQAIDLLLPYGRGGDVHLYGTEELRQLLSLYLQGAECRRADATSLLAWGIKGRASGAKGG